MHAYIDQRFAGAAEPTDEELENYFRQHPDEFTRNGQEMNEAPARQLARTRVMATRRQVLVDDWLTGLRRRAHDRPSRRALADPVRPEPVKDEPRAIRTVRNVP